jgi:hypothetical protein
MRVVGIEENWFPNPFRPCSIKIQGEARRDLI